MSDKIYQRRDCRLYKLSESNSEYVKNCRMFNGELKTIVDTSKLNISMLKNAIPFFKDKKIVCNIHLKEL